MSWNNLKSGVNAIVKTNGNQEITGANMQNVLGTIIDSLGANATFAGVATPSTAPGTPDGPVFYLAGQHGRYSNFGNVRFDTSNAIAVFVWDGSTWSKTELEFTVEGGGGGGGGGGTDIDPSIATFTSSKVTIKVPLDVWDEATFTKIFVGDDNMDVEDILVQLYTKTRNISLSSSASTGEDVVDIETEVLIEGDLEVLDNVLIHKTVTITDEDGEVYIESGLISADGIEADTISAGTILLNRVDLGTTLTALNTKTAGISRTVSSNVGTTTIGEDLVISGGLTVSGGAMIGGNVNCDDIFCGNVEADAYFTSDGHNIVTELGDIAALVDAIKEAQGEEVDDVTTTAIGAGVLIWHNGDLYKTNSPIPSGTAWANMDVVQTTVSAEINALRGVAVESVVLNITPTSAIPAAGVKARIYNVTTQTYMPEVTFTPNFNRALLGVVNFGDVYTIVMPSIDGYTQPADQTFQANQMLRDRTVEYMPAGYTDEAVTIRLVKSSGATVEESTVVVKQYDSQGSISVTTNLTTVNGVATINIPIGTKYSVTAPALSGFAQTTPNPINTASFSARDIRINYIALSNSFYWVKTDGSYVPGDTDPSTLDWNDIEGVATNLSQLYNGGVNYNFIVPKAYLTSHQQGTWIAPAVTIPTLPLIGTTNPADYNGPGNTANIKDYVEQQALEGNTYTSKVKAAYDTTVTIAGTTRHCFIPAYTQLKLFRANIESYISNVLSNFFGVSLNLGNTTSSQISNTRAFVIESGGSHSAVNKDYAYANYMYCIELI